MITKDAAASAQLRRIGAELAQLAAAARTRPIAPAALDGLADQIDGVLATFVRGHGAQVLQRLAVRAQRCEQMIGRLSSGDTSYPPDQVAGELAALRSGIALLAHLLEDQDRTAA